MLTAKCITQVKVMLYCHKLCHLIVGLVDFIPNYLLFLLYSEQESDISFRQQQVIPVLLKKLSVRKCGECCNMELGFSTHSSSHSLLQTLTCKYQCQSKQQLAREDKELSTATG